MRLQQLTLWLVFAVLLVVSGVLYIALERVERLTVQMPVAPESFDVFQVDLPLAFEEDGSGTYNDWQYADYTGKGVGSLRLATLAVGAGQFEALSCRYFELDQFPREPVLYRKDGRFAFVRPLALLEGGIYAIYRDSGSPLHVCMFQYDDCLYWMAYRPSRSLSVFATIFHRIILSLEADGRLVPGDAVQKALQTVCVDSRFIFCQPVYLFLGIPLMVFLLIMLIMKIVMGKMGRLPSMETLAAYQPVLIRDHVEVILSRRGKKSLVQLGLALGSGAITLFMFGKPYLKVDLADRKDIQIIHGSGFLGRPVVDLVGPSSQMLLRRVPFAGGRWRVRLYLDESDRAVIPVCD